MSALTGKVAVVTGVTSGIGAAVCRQLLQAGATVVGLSRSPEKLERIRSERFVPVVTDLADPGSRRRAFAELAALAPRVDLLVNNAAEIAYELPLGCPPETWHRLMEVNFHAVIELCQAVRPALTADAQILIVSSVSGRTLQNPRFAPYGITKTAVDQLALALRMELAADGIRVGTVAPGLVRTPIYDKVANFERTKAKIESLIPIWLEPEDVAEAVLWIAVRPVHVGIADLVMVPSGQAT